jgi:hypothetical protein
MPRASYSSHSSAIFPPTMRSIITPLVVTCLGLQAHLPHARLRELVTPAS